MDLPTRIKLVKFYYQSNCSPKQALRLFRNETGIRNPPCCETTVSRLIQRFETTGSVEDEPRCGRPRVSDATVQKVEETLTDLKKRHSLGVCSSTRVAASTQVPQSTVKKIFHERLHLRPYHIQRVQELKETDYEKRLQFANLFTEMCERDPRFFDSILWTDEAHFYLNGCVFTRNCVIWAASNPHVTVSSSLHPEKITVWGGFTSTMILPPFFFDGSIDGDSYLAMLQSHVVPLLKQRRMLSKTTFQQDGAPPHIKRCVADYLRQQFGTRIISRCFDRPWPPRSPDLSPADFWFWGALKHRVYQRCPTTLDELREAICEEMSSISPSELRRSCENILVRLEELKLNQGRHIENS